SSWPWRGVNALNAVISLFNALDAMRQQIRPDARIHGVITKGGDQANIIPEYTSAEFYLRATTVAYCRELLRRFTLAAEGAPGSRRRRAARRRHGARPDGAGAARLAGGARARQARLHTRRRQRMRHACLVRAAPMVAGCASTQSGDNAAVADLKNTAGQSVGVAQLTQAGNVVRIVVEARGLPPGPHGVHVHAVGKCDPPDFNSAGGHFNPLNKQHGAPNPQGSH